MDFGCQCAMFGCVPELFETLGGRPESVEDVLSYEMRNEIFQWMDLVFGEGEFVKEKEVDISRDRQERPRSFCEILALSGKN
jgi:hypothetical protein